MRLRTRVVVSFAALSLLVASLLSVIVYQAASSYLLNQRTTSALTRAVLDSRAAEAYLAAGIPAGEAVGALPAVGSSQPMILQDENWYTAAVTIPPEYLPISLLETGMTQPASQLFEARGEPYYAVAIPVADSLYVEVFPLQELAETLAWGSKIFVALSILAGLLGGVVGAMAVRGLLRPLGRLAQGTQALASGDLSARLATSGDADLDPIAESFNTMAHAVQARVAREQRFSANVSHELRSPLTVVLGTAELLEKDTDQLPPRSASLLTVLVTQVRRMSTTLLDILEVSKISSDDLPELVSSDVLDLCLEVVSSRELSVNLVHGEHCFLPTDPRRFERVVGNLVDNAQKHGGGLTALTVVQEDGFVDIFVDDAGPGVADKVKDNLFEPFARGPESKSTGGVGLGLAIAAEQAALLNCEIRHVGKPSPGARFVARFKTVEELS